MNKLYPNAAAALDGLLRDGLLIASGGFAFAVCRNAFRIPCAKAE